jgi:hypothetical protein
MPYVSLLLMGPAVRKRELNMNQAESDRNKKK